MVICLKMSIFKNMKLIILTIFIFLAGISFPAGDACAGVVKSSDRMESNYALHHRIIIYNDLTSFQTKPDKKKFVSQEYSADRPLIKDAVKPVNMADFENGGRATLPIYNLTLNTPYTSLSFMQSNLMSGEGEGKEEGEIDSMSVGSFLDSFKDDPKFRTIYFTSKDLIFGYKKTIANVLNLDFEMENDDYKKLALSQSRNQNRFEKKLTESERKHVVQQASHIFKYITESYKPILYTLLAMIASLYICFRYILSRYI
ncbi:hypothetical protein MNBD_ALPHA01-1159 [hydrothermal vent metagenome]|uniref:Uncharacterized protein n=1 Tax=hydrothermal vent metagenome TaxID=652676 RepID=A0A3B0TCH4_9ZZZZ